MVTLPCLTPSPPHLPTHPFPHILCDSLENSQAKKLTKKMQEKFIYMLKTITHTNYKKKKLKSYYNSRPALCLGR